MADTNASEMLEIIRDHGRESWGFTLYRTAYGPKADSQWQAFSEKMHLRIQEEISCIEADDPADLDALRSTFHLDVKSDPGTLDGASMDTIRKIHKAASAASDDEAASVAADDEAARAADDDLPHVTAVRVILLVDEEALAEAEGGFEHWVKALDIDYDPEDHPKWHPRMGRQRYFGWMKASTKRLVHLWEELIIHYKAFEHVAPLMIGGMMLEVWPTDESSGEKLHWPQ